MNLKNKNEEKVYSSNDEVKDYYIRVKKVNVMNIIQFPIVSSNIVEQEFEMESIVKLLSNEQDFPNEIYHDFIK